MVFYVDFDTAFSRSEKPNVGPSETLGEMGLIRGRFTLNTEKIHPMVFPSFKSRIRTAHRPRQHPHLSTLYPLTTERAETIAITTFRFTPVESILKEVGSFSVYSLSRDRVAEEAKWGLRGWLAQTRKGTRDKS